MPSTKPGLRGSFCSNVVFEAAMATMPPAFHSTPFAGWPGTPAGITNPLYRTHITALSACP
jgi:hypothetical protein